MNRVRSSERVPFRRRIKFGSIRPNLTGYTSDLSEGGMRFKSSVGLAPNSRVIAELFLDDSSVIVEGTVVWIAPEQKGLSTYMGLKFLSRSDEIKNVYQMKLNEYEDAIAPPHENILTH